MKRSSSSSPFAGLEEDVKPFQNNTSTPEKGESKNEKQGTSTPSTSPKKKTKVGSSPTGGGFNGEWTAEKREKFMDHIIALGYKAANLDDMAQELGLSKRQLINQLTTGRKNFRSIAVTAVRGE
ncbi:hypothetical protein V866_006395 [Kwoniella sp. B9012]|uniref:Uncharacterized protein n=1 Tax=Kwoniella europaea PYCC6329 TaxID=1423913 RepID=A0AAX4KS15_9TREE